jgi:hypothetical protein
VIGMMPIVLLAVAVLVKFIEMRRAQSWIGVPGKIVASRSVQRRVERSNSASNDEDHEVRNFAEIVYSYKIGTQTLQGKRLGIAADLGNSGVAEKLDRYRAGTPVTVYYNPAKPSDAVIERDLPAGSFKVGCWLIAGLTAALFAAVFGAEVLAGLLRDGLPDPSKAPIVVALTLFALVLLRFAWVMRSQAAAVEGWGRTEGRIIGSETEAFQSGRGHNDGHRSKLLRQRVTFSYTVAGTVYASDRVSFGARTSSSLRMLETRIIQRYPVGARVMVHYDPANPSAAVLERGARLLWVVWASSALFALAAVVLSGVLR